MTEHPTQSEIFLKGEGDGWYRRNKSAVSKDTFPEIDLLCAHLSGQKSQIQSILEIGCGNGAKLRQLCAHFGARGRGVEPSAKAVDEGNALSGETVSLSVGAAGKLGFPPRQFDLVYFGFCLYLVDRSELFAAIAEADRVLKPGGFLAILDFDPAQRHRRAYHHKEGVFSYKQTYSTLFTASGHYYLVSKDSFSHSGPHFHTESGERVSLCLLYKEESPYPLEPAEGTRGPR